jgi:hypothetical protein
LLIPTLALADPGAEATPLMPLEPLPASDLDAVRLFNLSEVDHLSSGVIRTEVRAMAGTPVELPTVQVRAEAGLTEHIQASIAEDLTSAQGQSVQLAASHLALRYSLGSDPGSILGNPALEAEFSPRANAPARAGLRLLASEEVAPHLVVAVNGYLEQNLDRRTPAGVDGQVGMTSGISYGILPGFVRIGAEGNLGAAQDEAPGYQLALSAGPNAVLSAGPLAATATMLADLSRPRVGLQPQLTLSGTF